MSEILCNARAGVSNAITPRGGADVLEDHEPWQNAMAKTTRAYGTASNRQNAPTPCSPGSSQTIKIRCIWYDMHFGVHIIWLLYYRYLLLSFECLICTHNTTIYIGGLAPMMHCIVLWWELLFRNKCFMYNIIVAVHLPEPPGDRSSIRRGNLWQISVQTSNKF